MSEETFLLQDLLDEAKAMDAVVLPPEVRATLAGFNVVRLRLLTSRNVVGAMKWAAKNPVKFECFLIHYLNENMLQKEIAEHIGIKPYSVRDYLKSEVNAAAVWDELPQI